MTSRDKRPRRMDGSKLRVKQAKGERYLALLVGATLAAILATSSNEGGHDPRDIVRHGVDQRRLSSIIPERDDKAGIADDLHSTICAGPP